MVRDTVRGDGMRDGERWWEEMVRDGERWWEEMVRGDGERWWEEMVRGDDERWWEMVRGDSERKIENPSPRPHTPHSLQSCKHSQVFQWTSASHQGLAWPVPGDEPGGKELFCHLGTCFSFKVADFYLTVLCWLEYLNRLFMCIHLVNFVHLSGEDSLALEQH